MFAITGLYAAALTFWMVLLGAHVSLLRAKTKVSLGDNKLPDLKERIRKHANLTENLPMAIIVMGIAEAQGAGTTYLHIMGLILLAARLVHPFGVQHDNVNNALRGVGATGTVITQLMGIGYILWKAFSASAGVA